MIHLLQTGLILFHGLIQINEHPLAAQDLAELCPFDHPQNAPGFSAARHRVVQFLLGAGLLSARCGLRSALRGGTDGARQFSRLQR
jgi:hypothetical protein